MRRAPSRGSTGRSISPSAAASSRSATGCCPISTRWRSRTSRTGDPVMRPAFYDYPELAKAPCDQSMAFTRRPRPARRAVAQAGIARTPMTSACRDPAGSIIGAALRGRRRDQARRAVRSRQGNAHARPPAGLRPRRARSSPRQPLTQSTSETPERPARTARLSGPGLPRRAVLGRRRQHPRPEPAPDRPLHARQGRHHAPLRQARRHATSRGGSRSR